jgi:hypothetical protein
MATVHHKIPRVITDNCMTLGDSGRLCLICVMLVRGEQIARLKGETEKLTGQGDPARVVWLSSEATREVFEAVVHGISHLAPQLGMVPVCWEHLAGIEISEPSRLDVAAGPLPPGLANGSRRAGRST